MVLLHFGQFSWDLVPVIVRGSSTFLNVRDRTECSIKASSDSLLLFVILPQPVIVILNTSLILSISGSVDFQGKHTGTTAEPSGFSYKMRGFRKQQSKSWLAQYRNVFIYVTEIYKNKLTANRVIIPSSLTRAISCPL